MSDLNTSHAKTQTYLHLCYLFKSTFSVQFSLCELIELKALTASWTEHFTGLFLFIVDTFS